MVFKQNIWSYTEAITHSSNGIQIMKSLGLLQIMYIQHSLLLLSLLFPYTISISCSAKCFSGLHVQALNPFLGFICKLVQVPTCTGQNIYTSDFVQTAFSQPVQTTPSNNHKKQIKPDSSSLTDPSLFSMIFCLYHPNFFFFSWQCQLCYFCIERKY